MTWTETDKPTETTDTGRLPDTSESPSKPRENPTKHLVRGAVTSSTVEAVPYSAVLAANNGPLTSEPDAKVWARQARRPPPEGHDSLQDKPLPTGDCSQHRSRPGSELTPSPLQ